MPGGHPHAVYGEECFKMIHENYNVTDQAYS